LPVNAEEDLAGGGIDGQVQLAPASARCAAVLFQVPLAPAEHLQPG
jgi:hypothetical protein